MFPAVLSPSQGFSYKAHYTLMCVNVRMGMLRVGAHTNLQ